MILDEEKIMSRCEERGKKVKDLTNEELLSEKSRCEAALTIGLNSQMSKSYRNRLREINVRLKEIKEQVVKE